MFGALGFADDDHLVEEEEVALPHRARGVGALEGTLGDVLAGGRPLDLVLLTLPDEAVLDVDHLLDGVRRPLLLVCGLHDLPDLVLGLHQPPVVLPRLGRQLHQFLDEEGVAGDALEGFDEVPTDVDHLTLWQRLDLVEDGGDALVAGKALQDLCGILLA